MLDNMERIAAGVELEEVEPPVHALSGVARAEALGMLDYDDLAPPKKKMKKKHRITQTEMKRAEIRCVYFTFRFRCFMKTFVLNQVR